MEFLLLEVVLIHFYFLLGLIFFLLQPLFIVLHVIEVPFICLGLLLLKPSFQDFSLLFI